MKHIDLFSGIGGFAYAAKEVWKDEYETVLFCDNDKYCQEVLRRHFPEVPIWGDIRELIAHTKRFPLRWEERNEEKELGQKDEKQGRDKQTAILNPSTYNDSGIDILTGGFPCQPFSQAGKRRGKSDDRFLWSEMLECIRLFKPTWVVAENVHGILSIEGGLVFEQVCTDMEKEGYEVWTFIVPACAVNAPHRRDRVWFVATKSAGDGLNRKELRKLPKDTDKAQAGKKIPTKTIGHRSLDAPDTEPSGLEGGKETRDLYESWQKSSYKRFRREYWLTDWKQVAVATCVRGVDDGLPEGMDGVSEAKHRTERLKMLGNSIVPQVAVEIMKAIKMSENVNRWTDE